MTAARRDNNATLKLATDMLLSSVVSGGVDGVVPVFGPSSPPSVDPDAGLSFVVVDPVPVIVGFVVDALVGGDAVGTDVVVFVGGTTVVSLADNATFISIATISKPHMSSLDFILAGVFDPSLLQIDDVEFPPVRLDRLQTSDSHRLLRTSVRPSAIHQACA